METQQIQIFNNPEFGKLRAMWLNNEPWFVGNDIAKALGYGEGKSLPNAIHNHVDEEDKGVTKMMTPGGNQQVIIINESGFYSLVLSSKLPTAKKFKRWVTSEVLPSIRKTGSYSTGESFSLDGKSITEMLYNVGRTYKLMMNDLGYSAAKKSTYYNNICECLAKVPNVTAKDMEGLIEIFISLEDEEHAAKAESENVQEAEPHAVSVEVPSQKDSMEAKDLLYFNGVRMTCKSFYSRLSLNGMARYEHDEKHRRGNYTLIGPGLDFGWNMPSVKSHTFKMLFYKSTFPALLRKLGLKN